MSSLKCSELMGTNIINDYYEFEYMLSLADECRRRGISLDAKDMRVRDIQVLSEADTNYAYYLRACGVLNDGGSIKEGKTAKVPDVFEFDMGMISALNSSLVKEEDDSYYWDIDYAYSVYSSMIGTSDTNVILNRKKVNITLLHILSYLIISIYLGEISKKDINFYFSGTNILNFHMYKTVYNISKTLPILSKFVRVTLDGNKAKEVIDTLDYSIYYDKSIHAGRNNNLRSCDEKVEEMRKLGLIEGSIAVLYERTGMNESNPKGKITSASIVRVDSYVDDRRNAGINFTVLPVDRTVEEIEYELSTVDEQYLHMFRNIIATKNKGKGVKHFYSLPNIAVGDYIGDENFILLPLEHDGEVIKKISYNGKVIDMKMNTVDAVYWVLCQRFSDYFDRELYRKMYNGGSPLLYDDIIG